MSLDKYSSGQLQQVPVFPLNDTILLSGVNTSSLVGNAISSKQVLKCSTPKLGAIMRSKCLNCGVEMNSDNLKKENGESN